MERFNKKPVSVRAVFAAITALLIPKSKLEVLPQNVITGMPEQRRHRGTPGVNMSPHQARMCAKRQRRNQIARLSRRVNRRKVGA